MEILDDKIRNIATLANPELNKIHFFLLLLAAWGLLFFFMPFIDLSIPFLGVIPTSIRSPLIGFAFYYMLIALFYKEILLGDYDYSIYFHLILFLVPSIAIYIYHVLSSIISSDTLTNIGFSTLYLFLILLASMIIIVPFSMFIHLLYRISSILPPVVVFWGALWLNIDWWKASSDQNWVLCLFVIGTIVGIFAQLKIRQLQDEQ